MTSPATPLGTLELLAAHLASALSPLTEAVSDLPRFRGLMLRLGWDVTELPQPYVELGVQVQALLGDVQQLRDGPTPVLALQVLAGAGEVYRAMQALPAPPGATGPQFSAEFAERLFELLLGDHLTSELPVAAALLEVFGIAVFETQSAGGGRPGYARLRLAWDELPDVLADPTGRVLRRYRWGDAGFEPRAVLEEVLSLLAGAGVTVGLGDADAAVAVGYQAGEEPDAPAIAGALQVHVTSVAAGADRRPVGFDLLALPGSAGAAPGLLLQPNLPGELGAGFALNENWEIQLAGATDPARPVGLVVRPGALSVRGAVDPGDGLPASGLVATLASTGLAPAVLLGSAEQTRLEVGAVSVAVALTDAGDGPGLTVTVELDDVALVVSTADLGSFLATLTGGAELRASFEIALSWTSGGGLSVAVEDGLALTLHPGLTLGPVSVDIVELGLRGAAAPTPAITADARVSMSGALSPLAFSVQSFGVALQLGLAGGNAGPLDVAMVFVPPTGVGCSIDAGVASGGGYLDIDAEAGTYEGVLDLEVLGVGISAVGIIETKAPDVDGWSLFLALFLDLPSIQLGFGFTLNGVGGLVGLNRTLDVEALQAAVRSGALGSALFPQDPIADAPAIIDTFRTLFPPADGRTVFGPVVAIGWGTPAIVEAELGVVISLPDPITIAVLGSITSVLPTADVDLVAINLDVAGVIDEGAATLSIDASLHDSHIVGFALSGDMALRADFADAPSFLLSLGGFHPGFIPPAGFPDLRRLSLAIDAGSILQVRLDSYLALTSNTVQFGAAIFVSAMIEGFGIEGGADFDALIQFSPFVVKTDLGFHVSITAAGLDLAGVWLDVSLEGPNPWFVVGSARLKVLGIETEVRVDEQIGSRRPEPAIPAADLLGSVATALGDEAAWSTVATAVRDVIAVASPAADDELVSEPDGVVRVAQQVAPMEIVIEHVGEAPVGPYDSFDLRPGEDGMPATGELMDWFAPASFFDISSTEGLAAPSFELLKAGIEFGGGDPVGGQARVTSLGYEQIVRDPELDADDVVLEQEYRPLDGAHALAATAFGASATADLVVTFDDEGTPFAVIATDVVVTQGRSGQVLATTPSWSAAHQSTVNVANNVLRSAWEVVP